MKKIHKALHLRHHKHTGKVLAHKHTSYRVLFLLMLLPILMLALVNHLNVAASNVIVNAKVPAPMPDGAPTIRSPENGAVLTTQSMAIEGTCPVITPAVIIAVYDNGDFMGSSECGEGGSFSVPVILSPGAHTLIATVVTITEDTGKSSEVVDVTVGVESDASPLPSADGITTPLRIISSNAFVLVNADGTTSWQGSFVGGSLPYDVMIDWGDGKADAMNVPDSSEHSYDHKYDAARMYNVRISVTDNDKVKAELQVVATTQFAAIGAAGLDAHIDGLHPVIAFVQQYMAEIYIGSFSALTFLWYIEHGHQLITKTVVTHRPRLKH